MTPVLTPVRKKILRMSELTEVVGLSRAWINKLVRDCTFPRPIKLGPRSVGWLVAEVDGWFEQRAAERDRERTAPAASARASRVGRTRDTAASTSPAA